MKGNKNRKSLKLKKKERKNITNCHEKNYHKRKKNYFEYNQKCILLPYIMINNTQ